MLSCHHSVWALLFHIWQSKRYLLQPDPPSCNLPLANLTWSSCNLISWLGSPCLPWSMLLASSSPSLIITRFPSANPALQFVHPPISASLTLRTFKHIMCRTEYAIRTCCVCFSVMVWLLCAIQIVKGPIWLQKTNEEFLLWREEEGKACIISRISSCANTIYFTSCENKIW